MALPLGRRIQPAWSSIFQSSKYQFDRGKLMAQHFLGSSKLRDLTLFEIAELSILRANQLFGDLRWGQTGKQICPACGAIDKHFWRAQRNHWRCRHKGCEKEFSSTQGTIFQDHKLPIKKILMAIFIYITNWKGCAAYHLVRQIDVTHKTAWVLLSKIRELIYNNRDTMPLSGTVHVDGAYFAGKRRDANRRGPSVPGRTAGILSAVYAKHSGAPTGRARRAKLLMPGGRANAKRKLKRRVVLVARQLSLIQGEGATRTCVTIARQEQESEAMPFIHRSVAHKSTIMSDENGAYNSLSLHYTHKTVQHKIEYQTIDGTNNNQAESFNGRMRRTEYGVYHGYRPTYLMFYACETAWQEDNRRKTLRERFSLIFSYISKSGLSANFRGYWQGHHLQAELLSK